MIDIMYYIVENGKQLGPFSFEQLKAKSILSSGMMV